MSLAKKCSHTCETLQLESIFIFSYFIAALEKWSGDSPGANVYPPHPLPCASQMTLTSVSLAHPAQH